jgi:hypothetical protein
VACRSCGALNDGAGGPPPAQPAPKQRVESEMRGASSAARRTSTGEQRISSGAAFTLGGTPKAADPAKLAELEVGAMREKLAAVEAANGISGSRVVFGLGVGAASVTALVVAGIFTYRAMVMPDAGIDWAPHQTSVASVSTSDGMGSAFLVEAKDNLWLVSSFEVLGLEPEVAATFRHPTTGQELLRIAGLRSKNVWVDRRFYQGALDADAVDATDMDEGAVVDASGDTWIIDEAAPPYLIAAANIEMYRPQIEALGIKPLDLASAREVRAGAEVVALGQTVTRDEDGRSIGSPTHALLDGTVSLLRVGVTGPAYLQTSAPFQEGCAGGPLLLESTQEVVGVQLDPDWTANRRVVILSDQLAAILGEGVQLGSLRREFETAAVESTSSQQGVKEVFDWPTYEAFDAEIAELKAAGWEIRAQGVVITEPDGTTELQHAVARRPGAQVALAVLARESAITVDVGEFVLPAGVAPSLEIAGCAWNPRIFAIADSASGNIAALPTTTSVTGEVKTSFLGQGIRGRLLYLFLERDLNAGPTGTPQGHPSAPSPSAPSAPNPSQPPAQPPTTPPSQPAPAPQLLPLPAGSTVASVVELHDNMAKTVYASSLIGLREFDKKFLTNVDPTTARIEIEKVFVENTAFSLSEDPELFRDIMDASLRHSFEAPVANGINLYRSRPLFEVLFKTVPLGTHVGVYLDVDPSMRRYLALPSDGLVSERADVSLDPAVESTACHYVAGADLFRVPLSLPWNDEELRKLTQPIEIPYSLVARYNDGSEDRFTGRMRVNPVAQVEHAYPFGLGFAAIVDETHPWVQRVIDEINQRADVKRAGLVFGATDIEVRLKSIALLWQDLVGRGLRYQNLTVAEGIAQRCRLVHESLSSANANCIDGTVLFASFLHAAGIPAYIVLVPEHAFVLADLGEVESESDKSKMESVTLALETTLLGKSTLSDPQSMFDELFRALRTSDPIFRTNAMYSLEEACHEGRVQLEQHIDDAKVLLPRFRRMRAEYDSRKDDPSWMQEYQVVLGELSEQIQIIPISLARENGVRPVGAPSNLDQISRLPPRR